MLIVSLMAAFASGYVSAALSRAQADTQAAFDRSLVERLVRAQEVQAREQEAQRRTLEAINHTLENFKR
jgi:hypothetical protein